VARQGNWALRGEKPLFSLIIKGRGKQRVAKIFVHMGHLCGGAHNKRGGEIEGHQESKRLNTPRAKAGVNYKHRKGEGDNPKRVLPKQL